MLELFNASPASDESYLLGESPLWDDSRDGVFWVDIDAGQVLQGVLDGEKIVLINRMQFNATVGAVVSASDGRLLVAETKNLTTIMPDGVRIPGVRIIPVGRNSQTNDGACDPAGRFLVGTAPTGESDGRESLLRLNSDHVVDVLDQDLTLSNGLAWSKDGTVLYSIDSEPGVVWARGYDAETGVTGDRRSIFSVSNGTPDGLCLDTEGNLWVAIWGAGEVRCYTPEGEQRATVNVDAPHTTSVAFVGRNRNLLLITTAVAELTNEQRRRFPNSGRLFIVHVGRQGLPTTPWDPVRFPA